MSEYRIDVVSDDDPGRPLYSEFFEARDSEAACVIAGWTVKRHATDPATQYGDLWVRDAHGGDSAEYVDTIEVAS